MLHILTHLSRGFSAVLVAMAAYCLFVACGGDAGDGFGFSCFEDDECGSSERCIAGRCERNCVSDDDCSMFETCGSRVLDDGGTVNVCVPRASNTNNRCTLDSDCVESLGDSKAECSIDGLCFVPEAKYSLLIRDRTVVSDPNLPLDQGLGADIAAIYLIDAQDQIVAQADKLVIETANEIAINNDVLVGMPNLDDAQMCIVGGFDGNTAVLGGEGGYVLVRFLDTEFRDYEGTPDTWRIVVLEWGATCEGGVDEPYEVYTCTSSSYNAIDLAADCQSRGSGEGRAVFEPIQ